VLQDAPAYTGDCQDDDDLRRLPPEVLTIQCYARALGRDDVLLDADADQVGDLPT
jgi:hypothetical protein